jgi:hypothetical protein
LQTGGRRVHTILLAFICLKAAVWSHVGQGVVKNFLFIYRKFPKKKILIDIMNAEASQSGDKRWHFLQ